MLVSRIFSCIVITATGQQIKNCFLLHGILEQYIDQFWGAESKSDLRFSPSRHVFLISAYPIFTDIPEINSSSLMIASCLDMAQSYRIINSLGLLAIPNWYSEMFSGDIWHLQSFLTAFSDDIN